MTGEGVSGGRGKAEAERGKDFFTDGTEAG